MKTEMNHLFNSHSSKRQVIVFPFYMYLLFYNYTWWSLKEMAYPGLKAEFLDPAASLEQEAFE